MGFIFDSNIPCLSYSLQSALNVHSHSFDFPSSSCAIVSILTNYFNWKMDSQQNNMTATLGLYFKTDDGEKNNMKSDVLPPNNPPAIWKNKVEI